MRNRYIYITLLSILGFNAETYAQVVVQAPRLVVSITIDQLRTDYLETYAPLYSNDGLKRLLTDGKVLSMEHITSHLSTAPQLSLPYILALYPIITVLRLRNGLTSRPFVHRIV